MKIQSASHLLQPATQQAFQAALAEGRTVTVPSARSAEIPALHSYLNSPLVTARLAQYRVGAAAEAPAAQLDAATLQLLKKALDQLVLTSPPGMPSEPTPMPLDQFIRKPISPEATRVVAAPSARQVGYGVAGGALVGAGVAALAEVTRAAEPTGAGALLVTLLGAVIGGGLGLGVAGGAFKVTYGQDGVTVAPAAPAA